MHRLLAITLTCTAIVFCVSSRPLFADGSAWLPEPGTGHLSLSYVSQSAEEFYRGTDKRPLPGGGQEDLAQNTVWLGGTYGLNDSFALDIQTGWAKSQFMTGPGIPTPSESFSGMVDTSVGLTWRIVDEVVSDLPSVALRVGAIRAGDYETGYINSLGDGGDGYEVSLVVGRFIGDQVGLSAELGARNRNENIPGERFANLSGIWFLNDALTLGVEYRMVNSTSGLQIGGPGFSPNRFPEIEEDTQTVGARLYYSVNENFSLSLFGASVIDGRNAAASSIFGVSASYSFDFL